MKKLFISAILFIGAFTGNAIAAPMYTDEIPQEYINQIRAEKNSTKQNAAFENISDYEKENAIPVRVYSPENIRLDLDTKIKNFNYVIKITNVKINDKFTFLVADDIYKNDKLVIKKGTPAIGKVRVLNMAVANNGAPPEFNLSLFTTKDVNNNPIQLYGSVVNKYDGFMQLASHAINKNKIYTLYLK